MKAISLPLALSVCVFAIAACSTGEHGDQSASDEASADASTSTTATNVQAAPGRPVTKRISDRDGTLTAVLPADWTEVPDTIQGSLISAASFPLPKADRGDAWGGIQTPCRPGRLLDSMPPGEALIRIWEHIPGPGSYRQTDAKRRPAHIRLPARQAYECGHSYSLLFSDRGRTIAIWVWTHSLTRETRWEIVRLINSLALEPAVAVPVRRPWMALDCRKPPNTLDCDRIYVFVSTRVPMSWVSVLIYDPSRVGEKAVRLKPASRRGPHPAGPSRTVWTGVVNDAGFRRKGSPLEVPIPADRERWTGVPAVAAHLGISGRSVHGAPGNWLFTDVPLLAGHG